MSLYLPHISMNKKMIPHCKRLAQVGKNVHSKLIRPTVNSKMYKGTATPIVHKDQVSNLRFRSILG